MPLTRNVFSYRQKRIIINDSSRIYEHLQKRMKWIPSRANVVKYINLAFN